jgi:hypothetical protein
MSERPKNNLPPTPETPPNFSIAEVDLKELPALQATIADLLTTTEQEDTKLIGERLLQEIQESLKHNPELAEMFYLAIKDEAGKILGISNGLYDRANQRGLSYHTFIWGERRQGLGLAAATAKCERFIQKGAKEILTFPEMPGGEALAQKLGFTPIPDVTDKLVP